MKKNLLFLKMMAVAVLLLMGVSAKAASTITVGASGASYTTIAAAYAAITDATGGYVIELQSDYNTAGETYPITLGSKTNANSAGNGITIQPKAGNATTFTFTASASQIFNLSGATYVTIDGLDATKFVLNNTNIAASQCLRITNDASNNTIKNITTQSVCTAAATGAIAIMAGPTNVTGEDGNTISNCIIKDGATKYTCGIYVSDALATNTTIQNNNIQNMVTFAGVDGNGIYIASADNTDGTTTVSSNNIYWPVKMALASSRTQYGINCAVGRTQIESNIIGYTSNTQSGTADFTGNSGSVFAGIGISTSLAFTCQNNKIANIIVKQGYNTATASSGIYLSSAGAGTFNSNIIDGITITPNGTNTNEFRGINNTSTNGTAKNFNGNIIRNCTNGASASAATVNIISGIFQGTAAVASTYSNNQIYGLSAGNASSTAANSVNGIKISVNTGNGILIERNLIYNLTTVSTTATTTGVVTGIQTVGGNTGTTIQNNMIDLGNSFTLNNTIYGIYQGAATAVGNPFKYYHNSVYIGGTAQASATMPTYAFYRTGAIVPTTNDVRNNILANQRTNTSGAAKHYAIAVAAATDLSACDYNLYWANIVGLINTTDKTALIDWKAALTPSNDANSYSSNPKFLSPFDATPNLHINTALLSDADNNGTFLTGVVTNDYDNDTRAGANSKSDIGADEYTYAFVVSAPTVRTTAVSNITRTTATSGVTIDSDGNATITASGVVWSTSASPDATVVGATKTTDGSGAITGLNSGTTYYVRAYATNSAGTSYGSELTFSTTVNIDANPADANGTVTGGGPFSKGVSVTLTATATASGKRFVNWTENGVPVSVNRFYTFTASSDRTLVANFGDIYTTYYVRPSGSTKWANIGAAADQIITTDNFNLAYLADNTPDKAATYYFAAGTYTITGVAATGTQLTTGKIYGGFTGDESSINLDVRATSDLDGNGIIEAWELTNATVLSGRTGFKYADAGTTDGERLIRIDAGGEVNGVTLTDFKYGSYSGAISIGLPGSADDASGKQGTMKRCIVRKIKSAIGAIQLINSRSVVDQCLIEDCFGSTSYGAVYFNKYGGTLSNSIVRNNFATTEGGAIYAGSAATATDLKAIIKNCVIYNNSATTKGGAISSKAIDATHTAVEIINSTIVNNVTGTGNASVEFDGPGLIVNSIVTGDAKADLYATITTNYLGGVVYGTLSGTSAALTTARVTSGKTVADFLFSGATATAGYLGLSGTAYDAMRAANFSIHNILSAAYLSLVAMPNYTAYSLVPWGTVPTTDITGISHTNTIGAYHYDFGTGIKNTVDNKTKNEVYGINQAISISNAKGKLANVYNFSGQLVKSELLNSDNSIIRINKGLYIVKVGSTIQKLIVY